MALKTETNLMQIPLKLRTLVSADSQVWDSISQDCFMQSWAWADFKELEGYKTFRCGLFSGETLTGGCIFYYYPHPGKANLLLSPGGPILPPNCPAEAMQLLLQKAATLAKEVGAIAWRIEPLWQEKPAFLKSFVRAPADLLPSETILINLQLTEGEILGQMKHKGRYNLQLSQKKGVEIEFTTNPQSIPVFYDLFWETVRRQQFFGEPYGFFINLCQTLFSANMAEIGIATWQGKILACVIIIYWGNRATYLYGGHNFQHPEIRASSSLHWEAMRRAKAKGCQIYDFYGYTRDPNHAYAKFSQFKRQFGGIPITTIGAHDYFFYDNLADTIITLLHHLGEK